MTRLYSILGLINKLLEELNPQIRIVEHYTSPEENTEYPNIRMRFPQIGALVMIREYWHRGNLIAYGYYLQVEGYEEWWDNRPHHPEIPTYPHNRHVEREVSPPRTLARRLSRKGEKSSSRKTGKHQEKDWQ